MKEPLVLGICKNQNQRTIGSGYFETIKEPPSSMKKTHK
jgi:hypothetical protein